jgi:RND family efflux transporter MFP subunit
MSDTMSPEPQSDEPRPVGHAPPDASPQPSEGKNRPPDPGEERRRGKGGDDANKGDPDALGRMEEEGRPEGIPRDLKEASPWRVIIIAAVLLLLLIGLFLAGYIPHRVRLAKLQQQSAAVQNALPAVEVVLPQRSSASVRLDLPGNALPMQQTSIYPRANGYLQAFYVDIGDHVKQGQLIADIATPEIDAQLAGARANVQVAQANLFKAQTSYELADVTVKRYKGLFETGGVTQQQLDEQQNGYDSAKSALESAKGQLQSSQAQVQRLAALVGFEKIVAPFNGIITTRNFDIGALLNPANIGSNQQLFDVQRTDILRVFVSVPQVYSTGIHIGDAAKFAVRNYPGRMFDGRVARTAGALDPRTRTLLLEVDFPNPDGTLLAGMYGNVLLTIPRPTSQLIIPTSALVFNAKGLRVAVVDANKKVRFQNITVGRDFGTEVEVTSGLTGQEQIVANPGERLADGVQVNSRPAPDQGKQDQGGGRNGQDVAGQLPGDEPAPTPGAKPQANVK